MNTLDDLLYRSGLTAQGCWDQLDEYDKAAVLTFGELIIEECISALRTAECDTSDLAVEEYTRNRKRIEQHFDV